MNRRGFFKKLGDGLAGAVAICVVPKEEKPAPLKLYKKPNETQRGLLVDLVRKKKERAEKDLFVAAVREHLREPDTTYQISNWDSPSGTIYQSAGGNRYIFAGDEWITIKTTT